MPEGPPNAVPRWDRLRHGSSSSSSVAATAEGRRKRKRSVSRIPADRNWGTVFAENVVATELGEEKGLD
ncbi:hypothetical protein E2562_016966 [Oryza meyeriana var. granulata]|uniref:Uncharacterized protein n=1 Tax=Oryza meyeriana var. granulata TaxID=110450 RepID=A0A6G1DXD2_9ORYZ|nr:hypothetical protein E2562_016966 [Oryza meyeriana var. granulata]